MQCGRRPLAPQPSWAQVRVRARSAQRVQGSAATALRAGPRSSALLGGYTVLHQQLEQALAALKHTEDALLFSSGAAAHCNHIPARSQLHERTRRHVGACLRS